MEKEYGLYYFAMGAVYAVVVTTALLGMAAGTGQFVGFAWGLVIPALSVVAIEFVRNIM